ncbi:TonB-dependent receptor [Arenicella chitinivorans]|uniref:TonB-dependent receptor n=1 Tax=Arenicella chitinivorans TaxID=1329800 RepID=A0A918VSL4_9GAMM|nr:TonB-dependent receptor [Arenicella chitinivorans]
MSFSAVLSAQDEVVSINALEEIVVTATRRTSTLQNEGITASALTADALKGRSVTAIEDASTSLPGVHIASYQGDTSIYIRGIGTPAIIAGNDSSTAVYVDDVYYSRAAAVGPAFFDVERVEVLRGPQGTLYGRNATGGAVNIVPKKPTEEFEGDIQVITGNYGHLGVSGAVSGSLSDGLRARLALKAENRDGYTTLIRPAGSSLRDNEKAEDKKDLSMRLALEADLGENTTLSLVGDYYKADDKANVFHYSSAGYAEEVENWYATREGSQAVPFFLFREQGRTTASKSRDVYSDVDYWRKTEIKGLTAKLDSDIGGYNLKVIANYKDTNPSLQNEFDLSDAFVNVYQREEDHQQQSLEFQLSGDAGDRLSWIFGGSAFHEENKITNNIFGDFWEPILIQGLTDLQSLGVIPTFPIDLPQTPLCCDLHLSGQQETDAWASYIDFNYELSDQLTLKFGGRYSSEERDGSQLFELAILSPTGGESTRFAPNVALFPDAVSDSRDGVIPDPFGFVVAPVNGPAEFSSFTPMFGVDYRATDDVLVYAAIQKGFKSGGYNIGSTQRDPFEPEEIWSYEAGLKSELADGRVRLNMAAFYYDYTNLQAQESVDNQPIIRNVGKAEVKGVELETAALVSDSFRIDGSITYVDAQFTEGVLTEPLRPAPLTQDPGSFLVDLDGKQLPRSPEWKVNVGAQWDLPINDKGDLSLRLDYSWQSKIYYTVFNIDAASEDAYGIVNARVNWAPSNSNWSVAIFGKNLSDELYFSNMILTGTVYGAEFVGSLGAPRTFGAEFNYQF